jgi:hypothetical protein
MRVFTAILALALALALTAAVARAQNAGMPGAGGGKRPQQNPYKEPPRVKADDKAYQSALKGLPDKPYDPWLGARAEPQAPGPGANPKR